MKLLLSILFSILIIFSNAQKPTDARLAGLDSIVNKALKDLHAVGVSIAVVEKNKIIYTGGFGFRDNEKKLPVTANTLFAIGSCTKAFTASLLGILDKEGRLDLDKPVITYLPELKFQNEYTTQQATLRDLMCHRTGLPRHDLSWYGFPTTRDSLVKRIAYFEPTAPLRQTWQYNNFMFLVQGVVAEKITGKTWEQNVRERIFQPLGMSTSNFSVNDMQKSGEASKGYYEKKDSIRYVEYYNIDAMGPAGAINSSANEMANWVMTWIYGGKFNGKEIIPASFVNQAMISQMVAGAGLPDKSAPDVQMSDYGFAWGINSYRGHYRVQHGGNIDGFSAITCFFPSDSIGIVVLINQSGSAVPGIIRNYISDKMLKLPYRDWMGITKTAIFQQKMAGNIAKKSDSLYHKLNTKPSHQLADYTGYYENPGYGKIHIILKNDSLIAISPNLNMWLQHYHYDVFKPFSLKEAIDLEEDNPVRFKFEMNTTGDISSIATIGIEPSVKQVVFTKLPTVVPLTKEDMKKYTGEYLLAGNVIVTVYIKGENTLMVLVPGQPDYELVPAGNDLFNFKTLTGYSVKFMVNESKTVTSLNFNQPNGIFTAKKK